MSNSFVGVLPAVPAIPQPHQHAQTTNQLVKIANRQDTFAPIYGTDTGTATAYAIAPVPGLAKSFYRVGQIFIFKAAHANSGTAPTLNVNGLGAGTITKLGGTALAIGDIAANSFNEVVVSSTTPTFELISATGGVITNTGATTFLAADVALNNVANFFSGPNTGSIGANGQVWEISATAMMDDTAGAAGVEIAIFDGSVYIANTAGTIAAASFRQTMSLAPVVVTLSAATTFTLRARDQSSTSGVLRTTSIASGVANKATYITAVRIS